MRRPARTGRGVRAVLLGAGVLLGLAFWLGPGMVAAHLNPVLPAPSGSVSEAAANLHRTLRVVDLHSDALLWDRSLLDRSRTGHTDLARWVDGQVAVQALTVVTKVPRDMNVTSNDADSDQITALAVLQLWPPRTWFGLLERALHQADKLRRLAADSRGRLAIVTTREELDAFLSARAPGEAMVAGFLGLEGAHALEGDPANVDVLFEAGFRMIGLTHFFDNKVGGSAHGVAKGGLTDIGRRVLDRMDALGMAVDLAHASPELIDDVVARTDRPVVVSHTGVYGTCPSPRNLDDARLEAIAGTGGVIGIGLWPEAVCGETPADWARAVRYAVDRVGVDHVALGSDWDGAVAAIVDAAGTPYLTAALLDVGLGPEEIAKIMGENSIRVLGAVLPERAPSSRRTSRRDASRP
ncbi:MAG: dipeptidase [Gemmatimonadota bacterium]